MCCMKNFDINELDGLDYESGKTILLNAGYRQKMGKENYEPCEEEYVYATDVYFVKDEDNEDKLNEVDRICCTMFSNENDCTDNALEYVLKTTWERENPRITEAGVFLNLKKLIGTELDYNDIVCAFEDFDQEGETSVNFEESSNNGYDYIAYIDAPNSTSFFIETDENDIITDILTH